MSVFNSYIYVQNRPTMLTDPSGRFPWLVIALVSFATAVYENNMNGGNFLEQFATNFAFNSLVYLAGVGLGGNEFATAATWQQSTFAAAKSVATSSVVRATAWEAQNRGVASDGTVYALALFTGSFSNYKSTQGVSWSTVGKAIGDTITYETPAFDLPGQASESGEMTNDN